MNSYGMAFIYGVYKILEYFLKENKSDGNEKVQTFNNTSLHYQPNKSISYYINERTFHFCHVIFYARILGLQHCENSLNKKIVIRQFKRMVKEKMCTEEILSVSKNYLLERLEYLGNGN